MPQLVTRYAPSPSGRQHVGGARTALYCWAFARGRDGRFILRIEDTDQKRSSASAGIECMKDLDWLGIDWNEGPEDGSNGGGEHGPYLQSQRLPIYQKELDRLLAEGKAYYAFDTPEELDAKRTAARAAKETYRYDGAARALLPEEVQAKLDAGLPAVVRFCSPREPVTIIDEVLGEATLPAGELDDFVIRKADGFPTYHFAVVVDDALMEVTHVLRAQEHFSNTAKHMLLQDALGFSRPVYGHLSIIQNPDGSKMSKRDKDKVLRAALRELGLSEVPESLGCSGEEFQRWMGDKTIQLELPVLEAIADHFRVELPEINVSDFRRSGYMPEVLCNFLALNGWNPGEDVEKFDNAFLAEHFDFSRVQKTPAKFDRQKLLAFNLDAIQAMTEEEFALRTLAHGREYHPEFIEKLTEEQVCVLLGASQQRSKTLSDPFVSNLFFIQEDDAISWPITKAVRKAMFKGDPTGMDLLGLAREPLAALADFSANGVAGFIESFAASHCEGNMGKIAQPLRIAASGGTVSPSIHETLAILGRDSTLARIDRCLEELAAQARTAS